MLEKSDVIKAFSKFGFVKEVVIVKGFKRGIDGFVDFNMTQGSRISDAINQVLVVGACHLYCFRAMPAIPE